MQIPENRQKTHDKPNKPFDEPCCISVDIKNVFFNIIENKSYNWNNLYILKTKT